MALIIMHYVPYSTCNIYVSSRLQLVSLHTHCTHTLYTHTHTHTHCTHRWCTECSSADRGLLFVRDQWVCHSSPHRPGGQPGRLTSQHCHYRSSSRTVYSGIAAIVLVLGYFILHTHTLNTTYGYILAVIALLQHFPSFHAVIFPLSLLSATYFLYNYTVVSTSILSFNHCMHFVLATFKIHKLNM